MKLKNYGIANFKAFGQPLQKIPIKPITLVFGPNSAGKSSLLHSWLWLNHAMKHDELNFRYPSAANGSIDLGGFSQVVNEQASPSRVILELDFDKSALPESLANDLSVKNTVTIELAYGNHPWAVRQSDISLVDFRVQIDGEDLIRVSQRKRELRLVYYDGNRLFDHINTTINTITSDDQEPSQKFIQLSEFFDNDFEKLTKEERLDLFEILIHKVLDNA